MNLHYQPAQHAHSTKDIKELLIYTLNMMLGGSFDSDKLYNTLTSLQVEIEDLSRIYNHMLIISILVDNEIIRFFLDTTLVKLNIEKRIETLRTMKA